MRMIPFLATIIACVLPTFFLASRIDADEVWKSGSSIALSGLVLAAYKVYTSTHQEAAQ